MIIIDIAGGLGNQMFQYALGRQLAIKYGHTVKFSTDSYNANPIHNGFELERVFDLLPQRASLSELLKTNGFLFCNYKVRRLLHRYPLNFFVPKNIIFEPKLGFDFSSFIFRNNLDYYLHGDWQSEKYFSDCFAEIKKDFTFRAILDSVNSKILESIKKSLSVSIHIRRGDYLNNKRVSAVLGICDFNYIISSINIIKNNFPTATFFVFSDDPEWVRAELLPLYNNLTIIKNNLGKDSFIDMFLMSMCKHNIIANSSFSWWGAWLNQNDKKFVIAPRKWFANGTPTPNLIPSNWMRI